MSESKDQKMENRAERRVIAAEDVELRVGGGDGEPKKIVGYAARFNKDSVDIGFIEQIAPGAFAKAIKKSDVRALKNHDPNLILGRTTNGTLSLAENTRGLKFEVEPPDTATGRDTLAEVARGDITGASFAFTVADGGDSWTQKDGRYLRVINVVEELFDVGPVTYPAYPDTAVATRSLEAFKAQQLQPPAEHKDAEPQPETQAEPAPEAKPQPEPRKTMTVKDAKAQIAQALVEEQRQWLREVERGLVLNRPRSNQS